MADETSTTGMTGPNDASKKGGSPVDEARIIEEEVIKPASSFVKPVPPPVIPPPVVKKPEVIAPPTLPVAPPAIQEPPTPPVSKKVEIPPLLPPHIEISPIQKPIAPAAPPVSSAPITKLDPLPQKPPAPVQPATPLSLPLQEVVEKEREDIARILKETKLPERSASVATQGDAKGKVFDTALGAAVSYLDEKKPEALATLPPVKEKFPEAPAISPLRTLKQDLQEIVQVKKISLVRAAALEQEKRQEGVKTDPSPQTKSRRTSGILFAVALLVLLGGGALFGVYVVMQGYSNAPQSSASSILFAESAMAVPLKNQSPIELKRLFAQARTSVGGALGSITRLVPLITETTPEGIAAERPATLEEFFRALGTRTSGDLTRALSSEFFFGIHTVDENAPLFVIPVLSYERAFAGMLSWEQTMNADLAPAFTSMPVQTIGASGLPEKRLFEDVVMRNYDVRALKDDAGEIQLYYSFPTRSILVISESPYSFTEVLSRLRAERKL